VTDRKRITDTPPALAIDSELKIAIALCQSRLKTISLIVLVDLKQLGNLLPEHDSKLLRPYYLSR
jgi:hypothetical protein